MDTDTDRRQAACHELTRRALIEEWDPIGIGSFPQANDEYESYVPGICQIIFSNSSREVLIDYLWRLETEHMGLSGDRMATERFADRLISIASHIK